MTSRYLAALAAVALLAGACTDGDTAAGPRATASAPGESPGPTSGATPSPGTTEEGVAPENVLTVAIKEPATLDPMRIQDPGAALIARQLYEGLTAWDPELEEVEPAAARSWKESDGGRVFTFKLREGMTFHDGTPVTAQDFEFAFDRIAYKKNASDIAYTLDRVAGFVATNQIGSTKHLRGVKAPDEDTLVVALKKPFRDFPAVLTHPGLVPLTADAVKDTDAFLSQPIGNGPFRMTQSWGPGEPVVLDAFPGAVEAPSIDGIQFVPFPDAAASWLAFVEEDIDVAEVPTDQFESAAERYGEEGYRPLLSGSYYGFNLDSKQLDSERKRMAINRAIDREQIADSIYGHTLSGPRGVVPEGMPGFDEDACGKVCDHSPRAAERLVAGLPLDDREVSIDFTKGEPHGEVARAIRDDLEAVGLAVKLRAFSFKEYLKRLRAGKQSMYRFGWITEYPVADDFLSSLFGSDSPDNHSGLSSEKIDALLAKAQRAAKATKRLELYRRAENAILKKVPIVPIGSFISHWAAQPRVEGVVFDVMGGFDAAPITLESP